MRITVHLFAAAAAFALPAVANAQAAPQNGAVTITFSQAGTDVVASATGFLNTTGLTVFNFSIPAPAVFASTASTIVGGGGLAYFSASFTGPGNFGSGGFFAATSATGPGFGFNPTTQTLLAPTGYTSGSALSATATYAGTTLAALGLTSGSYVFTSSQNAFTVNIGQLAAGPVPEPATWAMMIVGAGAIGFAMRRRRTTVRVSHAG